MDDGQITCVVDSTNDGDERLLLSYQIQKPANEQNIQKILTELAEEIKRRFYWITLHTLTSLFQLLAYSVATCIFSLTATHCLRQNLRFLSKGNDISSSANSVTFIDRYNACLISLEMFYLACCITLDLRHTIARQQSSTRCTMHCNACFVMI
ncbi:hypothetical protein GQX74_009536 [Glossina fuscipes]|nr:hypothetical protein GQX74_009536 [Glossina fuscipes]